MTVKVMKKTDRMMSEDISHRDQQHEKCLGNSLDIWKYPSHMGIITLLSMPFAQEINSLGVINEMFITVHTTEYRLDANWMPQF